MSQHQLDARHLLCPLPVIRTQNKIKELADGDTLRVLCTDPGALHDIPAWCRVHGHHVLEASEGEDELTITIKVQKGDQSGTAPK
ncbi:MAG TPA: sulfurtransferase TusA family protein [Gammaproteobacteria bacterium]|nr:sulfurtransferase TusA family protein [Gammaproteobacteria bacterium]